MGEEDSIPFAGGLIPDKHRDHIPTRLDVWDREPGFDLTHLHVVDLDVVDLDQLDDRTIFNRFRLGNLAPGNLCVPPGLEPVGRRIAAVLSAKGRAGKRFGGRT
jgi:hypothetical protein